MSDFPGTVAAVTRELDRYEAALMANDTTTLDALFWRDPRAVRFGATENLVGWDEIAAFRALRDAAFIARTVVWSQVVAFGPDVAIANRVFQRVRDGRAGRQSQTWIRVDGQWRIAAAHVSLLPVAG